MEEHMEDLARSIPGCASNFYLVTPGNRVKEVIAQLSRPAFRDDLAGIDMDIIAFEELLQDCDALCKFGEDHNILKKVSQKKPVI